MESDSILDAKLKAAELEISNLKSQNLSQSNIPDEDRNNDNSELLDLRLKIEDAEATINFMLNRVKSLI